MTRSYAEAHASFDAKRATREVLGAGKIAKIDWVEIVWPKPSGKVQRITSPPMNRYITIREET